MFIGHRMLGATDVCRMDWHEAVRACGFYTTHSLSLCALWRTSEHLPLSVHQHIIIFYASSCIAFVCLLYLYMWCMGVIMCLYALACVYRHRHHSHIIINHSHNTTPPVDTIWENRNLLPTVSRSSKRNTYGRSHKCFHMHTCNDRLLITYTLFTQPHCGGDAVVLCSPLPPNPRTHTHTQLPPATRSVKYCMLIFAYTCNHKHTRAHANRHILLMYACSNACAYNATLLAQKIHRTASLNYSVVATIKL